MLLRNIFTYLGLEGIWKSGKDRAPVRLFPCTLSTSDPSGSFREIKIVPALGHFLLLQSNTRDQVILED